MSSDENDAKYNLFAKRDVVKQLIAKLQNILKDIDYTNPLDYKVRIIQSNTLSMQDYLWSLPTNQVIIQSDAYASNVFKTSTNNSIKSYKDCYNYTSPNVVNKNFALFAETFKCAYSREITFNKGSSKEIRLIVSLYNINGDQND